MRDERIPDAVAALVVGVLQSSADRDPSRLGHLIVRELEREGWRITPGRDRTHQPSRT